jgi:molybdopterin-guanine dinucleotide biosynthesis protein A
MELDEQGDHAGAETVGGVVLAGGKSSRMDGTDKALMRLAGQPLLAHVIARLAPQVSDLIVSANGDLSRFAPFGLPLVVDSFGEYPGPLAGLLAGLEWYAEHRPEIWTVVAVPADTPFLPPDLVARLLATKMSALRPSIARSEGGMHPVIGLWPVAIAPDLRDALSRGVRKVGAWAEQQSAIEVPFPQAEVCGKVVDPFFNINQPKDLAMAEELLRTRTP